jgi:Galactose oxidase, central domain
LSTPLFLSLSAKMSFWSRNKSKKDTNIPTSTNTTPSSIPVSIPNGSGIPTMQSPQPGAQPGPYTQPPRSNGNNTPTTNPNSPPDSPSTIVGSKSATPGNAPVFPWSMRKFRNANPFPRFGHAANVSAGKEGEIYVFGGLVKEKRKNDLFVIDSGISSILGERG